MKVSILLTTYNRAEMLPYAIRSALKQTHEDIELVLYDDGSTDNTPEVVASFEDKRIRYIRSEKNNGVGAARAMLMSLAEGEYGCWLDSDDMCNIWRVMCQVTVMKKYDPPFLRTGRTIFGTRKRVGADAWLKKPRRSPDQRLSSPTMMFRVARAREVAYDVRLRCGSDVVWEAEATLKFGRGMYLPLAVYHFGRGHRTRVTIENKTPHLVPFYENSLQIKADRLEAIQKEVGKLPPLRNVPDGFTRLLLRECE